MSGPPLKNHFLIKGQMAYSTINLCAFMSTIQKEMDIDYTLLINFCVFVNTIEEMNMEWICPLNCHNPLRANKPIPS